MASFARVLYRTSALRTAGFASSRKAFQRSQPLQARSFATAHPKPEYTGVEAAVRKVLPEDYQLTLATMGTLITIVFLSTRGGKKKEEPVAAATGAADSNIPSMFDDAFEEFSKVPGNLEKWEASIDDW